MECYTAEDISQAFLAAPPLISDQIRDLSMQWNSWFAENWQLKQWPLGMGNSMQQWAFRGSVPAIERGFNSWSKLADVQGCSPCQPQGCGYNWETLGGYGLESYSISLMEKDYRTPDYCIKTIQSTFDFQNMFGKIVENMANQIKFIKEFNIGQNAIQYLSKKYVVDSSGPKMRNSDIYTYPTVGTARLSTLNIELLKAFYNRMTRMTNILPYGQQNGKPLYSVAASPELFERLYRDDPNLRWDIRHSSFADDLVTKYNFMDTIQGMFIPAHIQFPRRFNVVSNELVEVMPFINGLPSEVGKFSDINPAWENATHEEVLLNGKDTFSVYTQGNASSLPGGADFGPEPSFLDENWRWVNPETECDPFRRTGFFATTAKIAIAPQYSEGTFGIVVERVSLGLMAMFTPNPVCPVAPQNCNNNIPSDTACPCPIVLDIIASPLGTANEYIFTFAAPVSGTVDDAVVFELDSGATVSGNLDAVSADGLRAQITFAGGLQGGSCANIIGVQCSALTAQCSATVLKVSDCRSGVSNTLDVYLSNAIRAVTANDDVTAFLADGTSITLNLVSVDAANLKWTFNYNGGSPTMEDFTCRVGGIVKVCVPTATVASCPACSPTVTPCAAVINDGV